MSIYYFVCVRYSGRENMEFEVQEPEFEFHTINH